jgi:DNA replication licensing factor MCM4
LQETPDEIPEGGTPHTVSVLMHDKLVDAGKPGDRVEVRNGALFSFDHKSWYLVLVSTKCKCIFFLLLQITGIYRAMSIRVGPTQRTVKSIFKVNCRHFSRYNGSIFSQRNCFKYCTFSHGMPSSSRHISIAFT